MTEPTCCGEPMVHNTYAERWECADAYFGLIDDKVLADHSGGYLLVAEARLSDDQRERYHHWLSATKPSGLYERTDTP